MKRTIDKDKKFYIKYIFPLFPAVLSLVVISQTYMTTLKDTDLVANTGKVISIIKDKYHHSKYTDDRITIKLDNFSESFYFFNNHGDNFAVIMSSVNVGDSLTLFHRTKLQARFGSGSEFIIEEIKKGENYIYKLNNSTERYKNTAIFAFVGAVILWFLYFILRQKIKN